MVRTTARGYQPRRTSSAGGGVASRVPKVEAASNRARARRGGALDQGPHQRTTPAGRPTWGRPHQRAVEDRARRRNAARADLPRAGERLPAEQPTAGSAHGAGELFVALALGLA